MDRTAKPENEFKLWFLKNGDFTREQDTEIQNFKGAYSSRVFRYLSHPDLEPHGMIYVGPVGFLNFLQNNNPAIWMGYSTKASVDLVDHENQVKTWYLHPKLNQVRVRTNNGKIYSHSTWYHQFVEKTLKEADDKQVDPLDICDDDNRTPELKRNYWIG